eukprot:CAMPEP_0170451886 /NCGR_PEP_ID=MMETSP0123-20130129/980_1 /TAXON_ID=182087 /ORGANISM="Favella ehrenbergii, Strain Fehren 1" /LENGTH=65 /DNA_ID=CAMNT_0010713731 /DNA_START=185 /DNA_END=382 /DNA_ORIENTATION=-
MAKNAQQVRMFEDLKKLFDACHENHLIREEPGEDAELKEIAEEEIESLQEQIEEFTEDIVEVILP